MKKCKVIKILLYIMPLLVQLHGLTINEENLSDLGQKRLVLPQNSEVVTVSNLYGIPLTIENFHPGQKFLDLISKSDTESPIPFEISRFSNDRPQISAQYVFHLMNSAYKTSLTSNLILIMGQPRSGKTMTLRQLEQRFHNVLPSDLTVFVKLSDAINPENVNTLTLDDMIRASIHEDFVDLFKNVAEVNPAKVRFLLDGVDQVLHAQEKILSIVSELHSKKIRVIMTSCTNLRHQLTLRNMEHSVFKIPQTLENEKMENYIIEFWEQKYALLRHDLILQFAKTFQILIQETPLPRTVEMLTKVADFMSNNKNFLFLESYTGPNSRQWIFRHILKSSDTLRFQKMKFYRDYFEHLQPIKDFYGPQALDMIFKIQSVSSITRELRAPILISKHLLAVHGQDAFKFLIFREGLPVDFVHEEYKRYFAAEYILESFSTVNPLIETFKAVLQDPSNKFVMEFIDSAMDNFAHFNKMKTILSLETEYTFAVLDNLIEHRFDKSCSKIFEMIGPKLLKEYLNSPLSLQCKNKYSLGMLAEVQNAEYLPRKTRWSELSGTRPEMLVYLELSKSLNSAKVLGWRINPHTKLVYYARVGHRELKIFLMKKYRMTFVTDEVNKAMYESVRALGEESIPTLIRLKLLGGDVKNFAINGRTLAHVAAEWLSPSLLRFVHEELGVPLIDSPDNFGRTILATICDAGWLTMKTMGGAWATMGYLVAKGDISAANAVFFSNDLLQFTPKIEELPQPLRVLITGEPEDGMFISDAEFIIDNLVSLREVDLTLDKLSTYRYLIGKYCVRNMNNRVIHSNGGPTKIQKIDDSVTLSEFIAQLRGARELSEQSKAAYDRTIKSVLLKEANFFNKFQRRRAFTAIAKNTETLADLDALRKMIAREIVPTLTNEYYTPEVFGIFNLRENGQLPINNQRNILEGSVAVTLYDLEPILNFYQIRSDDESSSGMEAEEEFNNLFVCEF